MTTDERKPFVLVLMPFEPGLRKIYSKGIKAACVALGADCERLDEHLDPSKTILSRIYEEILRADLIVSDMSHRNPNVFYETGYAHALGKKVIMLTHHADEIPSNTISYPHIVYEEHKTAKLKRDLQALAGKLLSAPPAREAAAAERPVQEGDGVAPPVQRVAEACPAAAAAVAQAGDIKNVYPTRLDALQTFKEVVKDGQTETISIVGISLRDFLSEQGKLREVWREIKDIWREEQKLARRGEPARRLRVQLLLLDPQSGEGFFRYKVEKDFAIGPSGKVMADDIETAQREFAAVGKIYGGEPQDRFEARFYEHCPFSFLFLTDRSVFAEQYFYKSYDEGTPLPLIEYGADSPPYRQLKKSFEIIWEHARPARVEVGVAVPAEVARIENVFRVDRRDEQLKRQVECIERTKAESVDILAITGRAYTSEGDAMAALNEISSPDAKGDAPVRVRFALLNPVCQQAIYRAIADTYGLEEMREGVEKYGWKQHRISNLFSGVTNSLATITACREAGHAMEARLYSCSTGSSFLITPEAAFVGTYVYGRSKKAQRSRKLKSEYPLIEYRLSQTGDAAQTEEEIIRNTFKIIWNYYSIAQADYEERFDSTQEQEFERSLARVREELGLPPRPAGTGKGHGRRRV